MKSSLLAGISSLTVLIRGQFTKGKLFRLQLGQATSLLLHLPGWLSASQAHLSALTRPQTTHPVS
jgi:hypothetical protein